jgi:hypothetical protein
VCEPSAVGGDVDDGVRGCLARVDDDVQYQRAVEEGLKPKVGISRLSQVGVAHGRTKISVAVADLNHSGVVAVAARRFLRLLGLRLRFLS